MVNLEKIKYKKCQLYPLFKEYLHLHHTSVFKKFSESPLCERQLKFTPLFKKGGPNYAL